METKVNHTGYAVLTEHLSRKRYMSLTLPFPALPVSYSELGGVGGKMLGLFLSESHTDKMLHTF